MVGLNDWKPNYMEGQHYAENKQSVESIETVN